MNDILAIDYLPSSFFTTDPSQGLLKVVPRKVVTEKKYKKKIRKIEISYIIL